MSLSESSLHIESLSESLLNVEWSSSSTMLVVVECTPWSSSAVAHSTAGVGATNGKGFFIFLFMLARWWDLFGGILEGATRTRVTPLVQEGSHGVTQAAKIKTALVFELFSTQRVPPEAANDLTKFNLADLQVWRSLRVGR